ncbi:MAG: helix-turn-helix domain-containing protein [Bacteroides sp.]|nr:helix-turn-helix domain-containing protein [Bacteroides sp.]
MDKIKTKIQYEAIMERIEELLPLVDDNTPATDRNLIELDILSNLAADYEDEYYPVTPPDMINVIKLRMYEMKLSQKNLADLLNISPSRISDYLTGRSEPTLKIARDISKKLNIDPAIILGV